MALYSCSTRDLRCQNKAAIWNRPLRFVQGPRIVKCALLSAIWVGCTQSTTAAPPITVATQPANPRYEIVNSCTRFLLPIASRDNLYFEGFSMRPAALEALRWSTEDSTIRKTIERALHESDENVRAAGIVALSAVEPNRAALLATELLNENLDNAQVNSEVISVKTLGFLRIVPLADHSKAEALLLRWLASGSKAHAEIALGYLSAKPGFCSPDLSSKARLLLTDERLIANARLGLAACGDKASTEWLEQRLHDASIRYLVLSQWLPSLSKIMQPKMTRDKILKAAQEEWQSPEQMRRIMVARFDVVTGGDRGYTALERFVESSLSRATTRTYEAEGLTALSILAEHPRHSSVRLAETLFNRNENIPVRIQAAALILEAHHQERTDRAR